jgi:hypothetical protein
MIAAEAMAVARKELLDTITKASALLISITYVMGTIIVNSFLLRLGIRSTTLLSVEYISAGLPLALLFAVAGLTGVFFNQTDQSRRARITILMLAFFVLGIIMLYITNLEDYFNALRPTGMIFLVLTLTFFVMIKNFNRRLIGDREKIPLWSTVYSLIFLFIVIASSTFYGRTIYDDILPTVGGGAGSAISFITDAESGVVLGELIPMRTELRTEQIQLVRETNDSYLVVLADETSVSIDKDMVKGVIYHRIRGWEIAPSIFD